MHTGRVTLTQTLRFYHPTYESLRSKTLGFLFLLETKGNTTVMPNEKTNKITIEKLYPNDNEQKTPEEKLKALRQQIAIYQQQAQELEDQIARQSNETWQRYMTVYQDLVDFANAINGLAIELGEDNDIAISYSKNDKQRFKHFYHYKGDFPKKTADDVKEELTTAIAIVDQLHEKIAFKRTYEPKALLNPIRLSDTGIIVSFDKQTDGTTIVKAEKAEHTYGDGFTVTLSDTTTLKTINDVENDCVSQTICDTRVMTDFSQLHPLIEDVIRNIDSYQSKTID